MGFRLLFSALVAALLSFNAPAVGGPVDVRAATHSEQLTHTLIYSGTFDPPTLAHQAIIEGALRLFRDARIVIHVNAFGGKTPRASVLERGQMLRSMLGANADRVTVVDDYVDSGAELRARLKSLGAKKAQITHLIGEDSFQKLLSGEFDPYGDVLIVRRKGQEVDPRLLVGRKTLEFDESSRGISSTRVREALGSGESVSSWVDPSVEELIRERHLYEDPPVAEQAKRKRAFAQAYRSFVSQIEKVTRRKGLGGVPAPTYEASLSRAAWNDQFLKHLMKSASWTDRQRELAIEHVRRQPAVAEVRSEDLVFPGEAYRQFIQAESQNTYRPESTVAEGFLPQKDRVFAIKYVDLDVEKDKIQIVDSGLGSPELRKQFLFERDGRKFVRFYIHPESEKLYEPLMAGRVVGVVSASPTASTRSLLVWNRGAPFFAKLSLAKVQDELGRIIPAWEVRRSVGISALVQQTPAKEFLESGASIVPEVAGAYVSESMGLGFKVDRKQGVVREHGLIVRDGSFVEQFKGKQVLPLFALFTGRDRRPPLIIELWKRWKEQRHREGVRGESDSKSFSVFINEYLFEPFLKKNRFLMLEQGIIPEIHGQNVLVVLNPETQAIEHFFHRDAGSMKIDLRGRWIRGLSLHPLNRTPTAAFDFKFERAPQVLESAYMDYLHDWIFRRSYLSEIRKYVPRFNPNTTEKLLADGLRREVESVFPIQGKPRKPTIAAHLEQYYLEHPPRSMTTESRKVAGEDVKRFIRKQEGRGQTMVLPSSWDDTFRAALERDGFVMTEYGVVFSRRGQLMLAFHASPDLKEVSGGGAACLRKALQKVEGTFR